LGKLIGERSKELDQKVTVVGPGRLTKRWSVQGLKHLNPRFKFMEVDNSAVERPVLGKKRHSVNQSGPVMLSDM
jgi:hypothetical protein